jgi:hypothetical protein
LRAILIAHSIASAPELQKNTKVGEALLAQPRGEPLAVRALEQVRHVPELGRLLLQRRDQMRMAWPSALTATPEVKSR